MWNWVEALQKWTMQNEMIKVLRQQRRSILQLIKYKQCLRKVTRQKKLSQRRGLKVNCNPFEETQLLKNNLRPSSYMICYWGFFVSPGFIYILKNCWPKNIVIIVFCIERSEVHSAAQSWRDCDICPVCNADVSICWFNIICYTKLKI